MSKDLEGLIEISRELWIVLIYFFLGIGVVIFPVFNSTFFIPTKYPQYVLLFSIGFLLAGIGLGFVYARLLKLSRNLTEGVNLV